MNWTVEKLIEAGRGKMLQGDPHCSLNGISTDTRSLQPGDAFVALSGENHDGHGFVAHALAKGARALVVSRPDLDVRFPEDVSVILVPDTLVALGELARYHRKQYSIPVVGITGSNGKTSTKEMIASILGVRRQVLKNKGNFNNLIGVPLTLLSLGPQHEVAVVEMGINVPGEMDRLVRISSPTAGLITNIHPAHLEGLGSLDQVLEEKGKLLSGLGEEDLAAVNLDDLRLKNLPKSLNARVVSYSMKDSSADVHLYGGVEMDGGTSAFRLTLGKEVVSVELSVLGMHHVNNAVAAAALSWGLGESPGTIAEGLAGYTAVKQRMQVHRLRNGTVLVDDTYNANPESMLAAVRAVVSASRGKPCVAVLGEMREMGAESARLHHEVGRQIGVLGMSQLITLGDLASEISKGAQEAGMASHACRHAKSHDEIVGWLREQSVKDAWILVKGSRGMTMERVVEGLLE